MKKITVILTMLIAIMAMTGCRRSESNGNIDGFWRVQSIENKADGKITEVGNRYIAVQLELFQLRTPIVTGVLNYDSKDGKLVVDFKDPNPDPKRMEKLALYGIMENPVTFEVDFPKHNQMILTTSQTIIKCRRW